MQRTLDFIKSHKYISITIGIIIAYFLFSILAVNPIAKRAIPWAANKYFNSKASVASVEYDPFELSLDVKQFALTNHAGHPLTSFDQLFVDYELSGMFDWAWTFKTIRLLKPHLAIAYAKDGVFNWADMLAATQSDEAASQDKQLPRVVIKRIELAEGHFVYEDANQALPVKSTIAPLHFALEHFSTLPNDGGDYKIVAQLPEQEGEISWSGDITVKPLATKGKIALDHIDIPKVLALVKNLSLPVTSRAGLADLKLDYDFKVIPAAVAKNENHEAVLPAPPATQHLVLRDIALQLHSLDTALVSNTVSVDYDASNANSLKTSRFKTRLIDIRVPNVAIDMAEQTALKFDDLSVRLEDSKLAMIDTKPLLSIPMISLDGVAFDLVENKLNIATILLNQGEINAVVDESGVLDWVQAFANLSQAKIASTSESNVLEDGKNATEKEVPPHIEPTATAKIAQKDAELVSTEKNDAKDTNANAALGASDIPETSAMVASSSAEANQFQLSIDTIAFNHWRAKWQDKSFKQALSAEIDDVNMGFKVNLGQAAFAVADLHSDLNKVKLHSATRKQPVATLDTIKLDKATIDVETKKIAVNAITASGLKTDVIHDQSGTVNWQTILAKSQNRSAQKTAVSVTKSPEKMQWKLLLNKLALDQANIHVEEQSPEEPLILDIQEANVKLTNLSQNLSSALPIHVGFNIKQGGKVAIDGKLKPIPFNTNLKLNIDGISLKPLASYINEHALLELNDGAVSVSGVLALKQMEKLSGTFNGGFSVDNLAVTEEEGSHDNFLSWQQVATQDLAVDIASKNINIGELALIKPVSKFIIYEDKTLNITRILRNKDDATNKTTHNAAPVVTTSDAEPFALLIERAVFKEGELEFADLSLRPQFGAHINALSGAISGISSVPSSIATIGLGGKVDEYGAAKIKGSLKPFNATDLTDIQLIFKNLDMRKLTPYSGKFAGRKIDAGKMSVDLDYKIKAHEVAGDNKFVINKIKLGEKIDSKDATDLPLDLAIAILEDNNGVIDLDLPVSGNLDNPEFNFSGIFWKAFTNIMTKIVTAPFKLLGSLLGGEGENIDGILFEAGDANLQPPELEKIKTVSDALLKRNKLQLKLTPSYVTKLDTRALQERLVRSQLADETGIKMEPEEMHTPVDLTNETMQKAVKSLHDNLTDRGLFQKLGDRVNKPKPDFYPKALEALITNTEVTESDLKALAQQRGEAIIQQLIDAGIDATRLSLAEASESKDATDIKTAMSIDVSPDKSPSKAVVIDDQLPNAEMVEEAIQTQAK